MAAWLDLVAGAGELTLVDTGRLDTIVQEMKYPREQYPSVIYFAGNGTRMNALRGLFPQNNVMRRGPSGLVRLHISTSTAHTSAPTILLESNPFNQHGLGDTTCLQGSTTYFQRCSLPGRKTRTLAEAQQDIIRNCILPWTHILCLFVSSREEIEHARELLEQAPGVLTVGGQRAPQLTQVVIVLTQDPNSASTFIPQSCIEPSHFCVKILDLRNRKELSNSAAFEPLRRMLLDQVEFVKQAQKANGLEFSAIHLHALWKESLRLYKDVQDRRSTVIDCLTFARAGRAPNTAIQESVEEFLNQTRDTGCSPNQTADFIASALLMDAYPPEMHPFHPKLVFNALYREPCHESLALHPNVDCKRVQDQFICGFASLNTITTAAAARRTTMSRFYQKWAELRSTKVCFVCMCRRPEHVLACKHTICDSCVVIFGTKSSSAEYHTDISQCPICGDSKTLTVRRLPPTKGPVIFSLDGGGARGIVQLGLLQELETRLEGVPLVELPDLCGGTSVGGLSVIDLFLNHVTAREGFAKFPRLAQTVFRPPSTLALVRGIGILHGALRMLGGSWYDTCDLEKVLQTAIDPNRRLFDVPAANMAGCRVAVVASRTSDGKACVLANYRGLGRRQEDAAYVFFIPPTDEDNPLLSDVAQCSVAVPFLFRTKSLPGLGSLQDGGVRANNPLAIALKESTIIWPSSKKPDLALSIGTGYASDAHEQVESTPGPLRESALSRMIRATIFSPCMDGHQGYREALNYLTKSNLPDVFRLDHAISGRVPRLDDVDSLTEMGGWPFTVADELVRALLATVFFFELDEIPVQKGGIFHCRGSILCARRPIHAILRCVGKEFPDAAFRMSSCHNLGRAVENDGCDLCGYYRKKVAFTINSLAEEFSIELFSDSLYHRIGGFPKSVQQITREQQIYAHFGRVDHRSAVWPPKRTCFCSSGNKRSISFSEPTIEQKKRRL